MKEYVMFAILACLLIRSFQPAPTPKPTDMEARIIEIQKSQIELGRMMLQMEKRLNEGRQLRPILPEVR